MLPELRSDDILGGSFCSTDGFVDPYSAMNGFMARASENGATLWKNTEVTGISMGAHGVSGVETARGPVSTRVVVNAAGAWAEIGRASCRERVEMSEVAGAFEDRGRE